MLKFVNSLKFTRKNKHEIYFSFVVVLLGFLISSTHLPISFYDVLIAVGTSIIGFFCALNAVLDVERMSPLERFVARTWFYIASVWALLNLLAGFTTTTFSPA